MPVPHDQDVLGFLVLGPLEVEGEAIGPLGGTKQRALLADLVLHAGRVVPTVTLIDDLWGERAPATAEHTLAAYVSRLRSVLRGEGETDILRSRPPGYVLEVEKSRVDVFSFERLTAEADEALNKGNHARASELLARALRLWRGPALADVRGIPFADSAGRRLEEARLVALEKRIEADLWCGKARELVSELESLVAEHPYRESFHAQLMLALYRSGRQADALGTYRRARDLLADELGISPGPELQRLERAILHQDDALNVRPPHAGRFTSPVESSGKQATAREPRRRKRLMWSPLVGAALVVALTIPFVIHATASKASIPVNGVGLLNAPGTNVQTGFSIPSPPGHMAADSTSIFITSPEGRAVYRIDARTRALIQSIPAGAGADGIAIGGDNAWVANSLDGTVSEIDLATDRVTQTVGVGSQPTGIAVGEGAVWVTDQVADALFAIDPLTDRLTRAIRLSSPPFGVTVGGGSVWVSNPLDASVSRIDPKTGQPGARIQVGGGPGAITFAFGSVWVANGSDSTVSRIDPVRGVVTATLSVGGGPDDIAIGRSSVWVANGLSGTIVQIDPGLGKVLSSAVVGNRPEALTVSRGRLWVGSRASAATVRGGGTLRILSSVAFSIDPALAFPESPPQMLLNTYDTLVTYQRVGGSEGLQLVPDLALNVPLPSQDGTAYTFALRPGLLYSDGTPVQPEDFRRALQRVAILDPGAWSYFSALEGAPACGHGLPCDLSRAVVFDDSARTITFHLSKPDPDFLYKLAYIAAAPVPATIPSTDVGTRPVPATGPYMIGRFVPGQELDLVRNPKFREWSAAAQPPGIPDEIVWRFGLPVTREVAEVAAGRADWLLDPAPDVQTLSLKFPRQLHVTRLLGIAYAAFNTREPPFNDVRVRQAVSFAADRNKAVSVLGGPLLGQPTCQILPPGLRGYVPYCPFTVDPNGNGSWVGEDLDRAKRLIAASGTSGMKVTVFGHEGDAPLGGYLVALLRDLGYRSSLRVLSDAAWPTVINDSRRHAQASVGEWIADYPSPTDFFDLFFRCSTFHLGDPLQTRSALFFCRPKIDRQMDEAAAYQLTQPDRAADLWARIDQELTDQAAWVPFVAVQGSDFVSARVRDYQYNPATGIILDQLEVQ